MSRVGVVVILIACVSVVSGCAKDGTPYTTIPELASADSAQEDVKVGGVFVEPPVTSDSGTMFTIAESLDADDRIEVYLGETKPLETQQGSKVATGDDLVGQTVILTGTYDGKVFIADDIIIQSGGTYPD